MTLHAQYLVREAIKGCPLTPETLGGSPKNVALAVTCVDTQEVGATYLKELLTIVASIQYVEDVLIAALMKKMFGAPPDVTVALTFSEGAHEGQVWGSCASTGSVNMNTITSRAIADGIRMIEVLLQRSALPV